MKKISMLCLLVLVSLSSTAHAELTRRQITDRKELRTLSADVDQMRKDDEREKEEPKPKVEIGLSAEHSRGSGTTLSVPFSITWERNSKTSFSISDGYSKEFNNGNNSKEGLDDLNLRFSNSDALPSAWNIHGVSYSLGASIPMNQVSSGVATQSLGAGYKYIIKDKVAVLQPLVKITHYNAAQTGEDSWGKSLAMKLIFDSRFTANLSRKSRTGGAGLTKFDLGYQHELQEGVFKGISFEIGYSEFLNGAKDNSLAVGLTKGF